MIFYYTQRYYPRKCRIIAVVNVSFIISSEKELVQNFNKYVTMNKNTLPGPASNQLTPLHSVPTKSISISNRMLTYHLRHHSLTLPPSLSDQQSWCANYSVGYPLVNHPLAWYVKHATVTRCRRESHKNVGYLCTAFAYVQWFTFVTSNFFLYGKLFIPFDYGNLYRLLCAFLKLNNAKWYWFSRSSCELLSPLLMSPNYENKCLHMQTPI